MAAQSSATVVILMAMSKLEEIMDIFAGFGKNETPVPIIQDGTTPKAKMAIGTVRDIVFKAQYAGLSNPAVIVVGEVVRLHLPLVSEIASTQTYSTQARA
jgi:uroporphyrin-III C-methyltransferase